METREPASADVSRLLAIDKRQGMPMDVIVAEEVRMVEGVRFVLIHCTLGRSAKL
jgi:hypothetical protein